MTKRKKLINPLDFVLLPEHMEHPDPISVTVPDESYTIRQLLDKFSRGIDPGVSRTPQFDPNPTHDSTDLQQLVNADLFEREEYAQSLSKTNAELTQKLNAKAAADKAAAKAKADADFEAKALRFEKSKAGKATKKDDGTEDAK